MTITIRPATTADFVAYYGEPPRDSMRAFVAERDGKPIVFAGLRMDGERLVLFSDMREGARRYAKALLTMGRRLMMLTYGAPVFAVADPDIPAAPRFLARLGFQQVEGSLWRF